MKYRTMILAVALATLPLSLSACGGGGGGAGTAAAATAPDPALRKMDPQNWEIGPVYPSGQNQSVGVPLHPVSHPEGWVIDFPNPNAAAGHVHYVTMPTGSLAGKHKITMTYRIEMAPGAQIVPLSDPKAQPMLTLYIQRAGDNWSDAGPYETYRWYASKNRRIGLQPGAGVLEATFDSGWTALETSTQVNNPQAFADALANAGRIGFVLGGGTGLGHGVYATGQARLVITSFSVE